MWVRDYGQITPDLEETQNHPAEPSPLTEEEVKTQEKLRDILKFRRRNETLNLDLLIVRMEACCDNSLIFRFY